MKRASLLTFVALLVALKSLAQVHCDGVRYIDPIFSQVDSTTNLKFGESQAIAGNQVELFLDVYTPPSEFFFDRPLVILAHGGSFLTGNRKQLRQLCLEFASRGYVAATIDYRLFNAFSLPIDSMLAFDAAIKAALDLKAAIRWFKENASGADDFGIDTNLIFIGGVSAGGIAAVQCAYLDTLDIYNSSIDSIIQANGGIRGNSSSNFQFSEKVAGVLNYSGALKRVDWVNENEPPIISVHDEFDGVVPYGTAITTEFGTPIKVSGSKSIHERAVEVGIRSQLITIEGSSGHVSYFLDGMSTAKYHLAIDSSSIFLEYIICDRISGVYSNKIDEPKSSWSPNPATEFISTSRSENGNVRILDVTGRMVMTAKANRQLYIGHLKQGIYIVQETLDNGTLYQQKIIKE